MSDAPTWQPAALADALGVPAEAFRAFVRLRGIGWEDRLAPAEAAGLALAWLAVADADGGGPIAEAARGLLNALDASAGAG